MSKLPLPHAAPLRDHRDPVRDKRDAALDIARAALAKIANFGRYTEGSAAREALKKIDTILSTLPRDNDDAA